MLKVEGKPVLSYAVFGAFFVLGVLWIPYYLGNVIAHDESLMLVKVIVLASVLAVLFFADMRYLIFCTTAAVLLASSHVLFFSERFLVLRWAFLLTLGFRALSDWLLGNVRMRFRWIDLTAILFILFSFYSFTYSITPGLTVKRSIAFSFLYLATFWGVWNYAQDIDRIRMIIHDFLKFTSLLFILGLTLFIGFNERGQLTGFFTNPNGLGFLIVLITPLAFWAYLYERKKWALALLFLAAVSLALSRSRAAMVGTTLVSGYFLWFYFHKGSRAIATWFIFVAALFLLLRELFNFDVNAMLSFLRMDWETLRIGGGRIEAWTEVMKLIALRPWFGYGFGSESALFHEFDIAFDLHAGSHAHNSYLGLVSQVGVLGAVIFFIPLLVFILVRSCRISLMSPKHEHYGLQLALNAVLLGGIAQCFFESWIYSAGNAFSFIFWALLMISYQLDRMSATPPKNLKFVATPP